MTATTKVCKACGAETHVTTLEAFHGEEGPLAVTVHGMPATICANGHKRFLCPEFVAKLMDLVANPEKTAPQPPAVKKGLFKKHYHCNGCGAELTGAPTAKAARELEASFKHAAPFKVAVEVALHKCAACGREQVLSNEEISGASFKALTHGFRAADIHVDS